MHVAGSTKVDGAYLEKKWAQILKLVVDFYFYFYFTIMDIR